jgi:hypothetical protein
MYAPYIIKDNTGMNHLEEKFANNIGTDFLVKIVRSGIDNIISDPDGTGHKRSRSDPIRILITES